MTIEPKVFHHVHPSERYASIHPCFVPSCTMPGTMIYLDKSWRVPEKMRACPDCKAALESGLSLESLVGHKKNQVQNRVEDFRKEETKHIQRKTKRNMKKIVQFLSFGGVYSQREISRETGVCRVSVSKCMVLLESLGQARRVEPPPHEHRSYLWEAVREE